MFYVVGSWTISSNKRDFNFNYKGQILIRHMRPSARRLHGDNFIFQHDNDPKHTAHIVKNYPRNEQSPDLNPIESGAGWKTR